MVLKIVLLYIIVLLLTLYAEMFFRLYIKFDVGANFLGCSWTFTAAYMSIKVVTTQ